MKHFLQSCRIFFEDSSKKINYFYLLVFFTLIFSINLPLRYELPLYDEAFYSRAILGNYGWSPIYMLVYKFFNIFTRDSMVSYYLIFYILNVFGIPLLVYKILEFMWKNTQASFLISIAITISRFNYELSPKIHNFNFLFLLLIIYLKIKFEDKKWFQPCFYLLLALSLYIRSDNVIIFAGVLIFQFWNAKKSLKLLKSELLALIPAGLFLISSYPFWGAVINSKRNWLAFLDHYYWLYFQNNISGNQLTFQQMVQQNFTNCHSLWDFIRLYPMKAVLHAYSNLKSIFLQFSFYLTASEQVFWHFGTSVFVMAMNIVLAFFVKLFGHADIKSSENFKSLYLILLLMLLRSLITSLILQPQDKYILDFCFGFLVLAISLTHFIKLRKIANHIINLITFGSALVTLALFKYPNQPSFYQYKTTKVLDAVRSSILAKNVTSVLYTTDVLAWSNFNLKEYQLNDLSLQPEMRNNLRSFLEKREIDLIIFDKHLKTQARDYGLYDLHHFNVNYDKFGYEKFLSYANEEIEFFTKKVDRSKAKTP